MWWVYTESLRYDARFMCLSCQIHVKYLFSSRWWCLEAISKMSTWKKVRRSRRSWWEMKLLFISTSLTFFSTGVQQNKKRVFINNKRMIIKSYFFSEWRSWFKTRRQILREKLFFERICHCLSRCDTWTKSTMIW